MHGQYIDVVVEEQEGIPDGCELRFHAVGESRPVKRVHYEPLTGPDGEYEVTAAGGEWDPLESTCRHASLSIL